jgi:hypothetical protein
MEILKERVGIPPSDRSPPSLPVCQTVLTLETLKARHLVGEGEWLRVGQVARILGVSVGTARNYIDAGVFNRVRRLKHGDRRVWSEDVVDYLNKMEEDQGERTARPGPADDH